MMTRSASIRGLLVNRCRCNAPRTSMGRPLCQETKRMKLERKRSALQASSIPATVTMTRSNTAAADLTKRCRMVALNWRKMRLHQYQKPQGCGKRNTLRNPHLPYKIKNQKPAVAHRHDISSLEKACLVYFGE